MTVQKLKSEGKERWLIGDILQRSAATNNCEWDGAAEQ